MRSISNKKKSKTKAAIIVALVIAVPIILWAYLFPMNGELFGWRATSPKSDSNTQTKAKDINLDKPTDEEVKAGQDIKKETTKPEPETTNPTHKVGVSLTAASVAADTLQIRVLIEGIVSNSSCSLVLDKGSLQKTYTAPTQALSSSSTCQGFNVPTSELSPGIWSFTVTVTDGEISGSTTGEVTI